MADHEGSNLMNDIIHLWVQNLEWLLGSESWKLGWVGGHRSLGRRHGLGAPSEPSWLVSMMLPIHHNGLCSLLLIYHWKNWIYCTSFLPMGAEYRAKWPWTDEAKKSSLKKRMQLSLLGAKVVKSLYLLLLGERTNLHLITLFLPLIWGPISFLQPVMFMSVSPPQLCRASSSHTVVSASTGLWREPEIQIFLSSHRIAEVGSVGHFFFFFEQTMLHAVSSWVDPVPVSPVIDSVKVTLLRDASLKKKWIDIGNWLEERQAQRYGTKQQHPS